MRRTMPLSPGKRRVLAKRWLRLHSRSFMLYISVAALCSKGLSSACGQQLIIDAAWLVLGVVSNCFSKLHGQVASQAFLLA